MTEKPEVTDEHRDKAKEMAKVYDDALQTTTLPGSEGTVSGTAVTDWVDDKDKGSIETTAEEGKVVWDFDTVRGYETVNGVRASGGAVNGPGAVVVGGMVLVNSGYGRSGGLEGNVLLAFAPGE